MRLKICRLFQGNRKTNMTYIYEWLNEFLCLRTFRYSQDCNSKTKKRGRCVLSSLLKLQFFEFWDLFAVGPEFRNQNDLTAKSFCDPILGPTTNAVFPSLPFAHHFEILILTIGGTKFRDLKIHQSRIYF